MPGFYNENSTVMCDGVSLASIAKSEGTPFYVYSAAVIRERYQRIDKAFDSYPHSLHYALKANSNLGIVRLLQSMGSSIDANSGGEIEVALRAGFIPEQIVFTGVGKTLDELRRAVSLGVKAINVESPGELNRIESLAQAQGVIARVAFRINPDISSESHSHISTGLSFHKFGMPIDQVRQLCRTIRNRKGIVLVGMHVHVGSQIVNLEPLCRATKMLVKLSGELRDWGIEIEHLDLGGGLGISYDGSPVPDPETYVSTLVSIVRESGLNILLEPGRSIIGPAGALVAQVVDVKNGPVKKFVVLDAGMSELMRPALYSAYHRIYILESHARENILCDVVGPICETADVLGVDRLLPVAQEGDFVAVMDVGAYGSAMASNYNRRTLPSEVMVDAGEWNIIRRRQIIDEILALEE